MDSSEQYLHGYIKTFKHPPGGNYGFINEHGQIVDFLFHINECRREDGQPITREDLKMGKAVKFLRLGNETKAKEVIILS